MSAPSNAAEKSALNVPELSQGDSGDDSPKKWDTKEPGLLPARNSSLPKPRKTSDTTSDLTNEKMDPPREGLEDVLKESPAQSLDKPPTPPPKNPPSKSRTRKANVPTTKLPPPPKKGIFERFIIALGSCCSPSETKQQEHARPQRTDNRRKPKQGLEMESLKKENEHPTLSTIGMSSVDEELQAPPVPAKKRDTTAPVVEEQKPTVTIAPDVITDKETNGQPRILTPPLQPTSDESDDELGTISTDDGRDRQLRDSLQIQAPFPPTSEEVQSEALLMSPSTQTSVPTSNESEDPEVEVEEVPRPTNLNIDEPQPGGPFLGPVPESKKGRKCLVLDLDECLIHSTFADSKSYDFSIALNLDKEYGLSYIYVGKRPHLDEFLEEVGRLFEIVIFTASLQRYADPVVDIIDRNRVIDHRLFRDSCTRTWDPIQRIYLPNVKNISLLGRDLKQCIIIDNNPQCYQWHPEHAVPISSWFEDHLDVELLTMIPLLKDLASKDIEDVRDVLSQSFQHS